MKKFLMTSLALSVVVIACIVTVNYYGDAARLFDNKYDAKVADVITSGYNATNVAKNFNERIFRRRFILNLKQEPEVLVLGSSRTLTLGQDLFPGKKFMNSSVSAAAMEDIIAIYQLYKTKGYTPQKIVLGIDPWTFNENNNNQGRWKSLEKEYNEFMRAHNKHIDPAKSEIIPRKYLELVSLSYFQVSLEGFNDRLKGADKISATKEDNNPATTWRMDGSIVYGDDYENKTPEQVEKKAKKYIQRTIYGIEQFDTLSPRIIDGFLTLMDDIRGRGIEVELLLTPYHPTVYKKVAQDYPYVLATEKFINEYAAKSNLRVLGSFDPVKLGMDNTYFFDGHHCNYAAIEKLWKEDGTRRAAL